MVDHKTSLAAVGFSVLVHVAGAGLVSHLVAHKTLVTGGAVNRSFEVTVELDEAPSVPARPKETSSATRKVSTAAAPVSVVSMNDRQNRDVVEPQPQVEQQPVPVAVEKPKTDDAIESQPSRAAAPVAKPDKAIAGRDPNDDRQDYLARLQAHIEAHKFYPRRARLLGIEGVVGVTFRFDEAGRVRDLAGTGAHRLLNQSAVSSVKRATPLPEPPDSLSLPLTVKFTMRYDLQR